MSHLRFLSKLLIPAILLTLYGVTLYRAAVAPDPTVQAQTRVLSPAPQASQAAALPPSAPSILAQNDKRLAASEPILGAGVEGVFRAYVIADFPAQMIVINDQLGETAIVIFADNSTNYAAAFQATVGEQELAFSVDGKNITDATGTVWSLSGKGLVGPLAGIQLTPIASFVTEWGNWSSLHPWTSIYGR